ncbi:MAG TPA: ABC transporter permease [Gaiellaceae bacterium]|jgi:ABC-type nitrate/sulfonate/bicarbonate transport system permease component|nr:ABC transporter permease [Gaiellaceae bacterium]
MRRVAVALAVELTLPAGLLVTWWFVSADDTSPYWPSLAKIVRAFRESWLFADVRPDLVPSLERIAGGFALGVALGVLGGLAVGMSPWVRRAFEPLLECLRATPVAAILPVSILLLGIGYSQKVLVIAFATTWPVLMNTAEGVRGIDPEVLELASLYRLRRRDRLFRVILPGALPQIFAGLRISLSLSLLAIVFAELYAAHDGLGYFILFAQSTFRIAEMWSGIFVLALFAYVLNLLFGLLERRVLFWHRGFAASALGKPS